MKLKNMLCGAMILGAGLGLAGCNSTQPTMNMQKENTQLKKTESRYTIKRVGVFEDDLAYENKRGIYEITDEQTKKEYLGVSGIGITELGSHTEDKSTVQDER